jgi:pantoate kinase
MHAMVDNHLAQKACESAGAATAAHMANEYRRTGMSSLIASATGGLATRINQFLGANEAEIYASNDMEKMTISLA